MIGQKDELLFESYEYRSIDTGNQTKSILPKHQHFRAKKIDFNFNTLNQDVKR